MNELTAERAAEAYQQHHDSGTMGMQTPIESFLTDAEKQAVKNRWNQLPGYTCWQDAFFTFLSDDKLPPYMQHRAPFLREKYVKG